MSETLSYQEPASTELNEAEQEAVEVGEQMEADQNQLLAGKYKSADELEKAYLELQQKLGSQEPEEESEEEEPEAEPAEEEPTEEKPAKEPEQPRQVTQQDIDYLQGLAGGPDGYKQAVTWASENMNQKEIAMFDSVMERGDPASVLFAVKSMLADYKEANGSDGQLLTGKAAANPVKNAFRSQQELVAAMSDPRYESDPAYRNDVIQKLEQSELDF